MKTEEPSDSVGKDVDAPSSDIVKAEKSVDQLSPTQQAQQSTIENLTNSFRHEVHLLPPPGIFTDFIAVNFKLKQYLDCCD